MSSWENELYNSVHFNNLATFKDILSREEVQKNGNLEREGWVYGSAPLHLAAYYGRDEMVQLLVDAGVKINSYSRMQNRINCTALHYAAYNNNKSTLKLLLELGADRTLEGHFGKYDGTALDWALKGEPRKGSVAVLSGNQSAKAGDTGKPGKCHNCTCMSKNFHISELSFSHKLTLSTVYLWHLCVS